MSDVQTADPHHAEYLAAVAGMAETYGTPSLGRGRIHNGRVVTTWACGDWITFRTKDHGPLQGTIVDVLVEDGDLSQYHVAAHVPSQGRQHFAVLNRDVLPF